MAEPQANGKGAKKERPYLKVCTKCHGKGQLSFFNILQKKTYRACDKCTNGNAMSGLGVTLKCHCQPKSAPYEYISGKELKRNKGLEPDEKAVLEALQLELGKSATALLLLCDCGAKFLTHEVGDRRQISGKDKANNVDKEHNKEMAKALAEFPLMQGDVQMATVHY